MSRPFYCKLALFNISCTSFEGGRDRDTCDELLSFLRGRALFLSQLFPSNDSTIFIKSTIMIVVVVVVVVDVYIQLF